METCAFFICSSLARLNLTFKPIAVATNTNRLDPAWLEQFRQGKEAAFDQLFRTYFAPLCFYATRLVGQPALAEDLVQDCFVTLWERRRKLADIKAVHSYLYRCVHNACLLHLRKNKRVVPTLSPDPEAPVEEGIVAAETLAQVLAVIEQLPSRMKEVLRMYYLEEQSYEQIGKLIGIDPETVRTHKYRAIRFARKIISPG